MNRIYKVVFNRVLGVYTAASELVASDGKKSPAASLGKAVPATFCALALSSLAVAQPVFAEELGDATAIEISQTITESETFDDSVTVKPQAGTSGIENKTENKTITVTVNGGGVLNITQIVRDAKGVDADNGGEVVIDAKEFKITADTVDLSAHNGSVINAVLSDDKSVINFVSKNTQSAETPGTYAVGAVNEGGGNAENSINLQAGTVTIDSGSKGVAVSGVDSSVSIVGTGITTAYEHNYSVNIESGNRTVTWGQLNGQEDVIFVNGGSFSDSSGDKKNVSVIGTVLQLDQQGGAGVHVKDGGSVELIAKKTDGITENPEIYISHSYYGGSAGIYTENSGGSNPVNDVRLTSEGDVTIYGFHGIKTEGDNGGETSVTIDAANKVEIKGYKKSEQSWLPQEQPSGVVVSGSNNSITQPDVKISASQVSIQSDGGRGIIVKNNGHVDVLTDYMTTIAGEVDPIWSQTGEVYGAVKVDGSGQVNLGKKTGVTGDPENRTGTVSLRGAIGIDVAGSEVGGVQQLAEVSIADARSVLITSSASGQVTESDAVRIMNGGKVTMTNVGNVDIKADKRGIHMIDGGELNIGAIPSTVDYGSVKINATGGQNLAAIYSQNQKADAVNKIVIETRGRDITV